MILAQAPYDFYFDHNGDPLDSGYLYFGQPFQNPETNPVPVAWNAEGTIPAAQPIRTSDGYIVRSGTPSNVFTDGDYSLVVRNRKREIVYYVPSILSARAASSAYLLFLQSGAGAVLISSQDKARQASKTLMDFGGMASTGTTLDCRPSILAAINAGKVCRFPEPPAGAHYYVSAPIPAVEGMVMYGDGEAPVQKTRGAKIYAPNGFITNAARVRYEMAGLWVTGASAGGVHGFDGPAGGVLDGCVVEKFDYLVRNPSGYLQTFRRCKFLQANVGIGINEPNGSHIDNCHFESDVLVQVDNMTLLPGAVNGGGTPFTLTRNNFNLNTGSQRLAKLAGSIDFRDNYIEVFGSMGAGSVAIEYNADRFGFYNLDVEDNHFAGQNNCERALRIYSNHASGTFMHGLVRGNWMRGFTAPPVQIGGGGVSAIVSGIEFRDNEAAQAQYVEFSRREARYDQAMQANYTAGGLNIAGAAYVLVPLTDALPNSGADLTVNGGTGWRVGRDGLYEIEVVATCAATSEQQNLQGAIRVNGVAIAEHLHSQFKGAAGGVWYTTFTMKIITTLLLNDAVAVAFRNGDTLNKMVMSARRIGDNNYLKV